MVVTWSIVAVCAEFGIGEASGVISCRLMP